MESIKFLNEIITYGVISLASASPVQSCHSSNLTIAYQGPTYAISDDTTVWKRKAKAIDNNRNIVFGGYENVEIGKENKTMAAN